MCHEHAFIAPRRVGSGARGRRRGSLSTQQPNIGREIKFINLRTARPWLSAQLLLFCYHEFIHMTKRRHALMLYVCA